MNLHDIRKGLSEMREGLQSSRNELNEHFADMDAMSPDDNYAKKMWRFTAEAAERLEDLVDEVNLADATFSEVTKLYGEDDRNMSSAEFYGIFKTFVTSYRVRIFHRLVPLIDAAARNVKWITKPSQTPRQPARRGNDRPKSSKHHGRHLMLRLQNLRILQLWIH